MPDIVLATLNARYIHTAFALRYLRANLGELRERAEILEFDVQTRPLDVAEQILAKAPRIVGLSVYIWNITALTEVVRTIKQVAPDVVVVLGGPEVSHESEQQAIVAAADYVVCGEGDLALPTLCRQVFAGTPPTQKVQRAANPDLAALALPYDEYTDADIAHRIVYVEASRGCPFTCEFCLSALDERVRQFPLEQFLAAMARLYERGVQHFKFVDRTFNLSLSTSRAILEFFLARLRPGLFLHFELIPDRLPEPLREVITRFPAGVLQFEVGVQTFDEQVAARVARRQDNNRIDSNLRWLREHTGVHIHADLIVGLPGEDLTTLGHGFDRLLALAPHEIQVGILKRLRGAPLARHDAIMRYGKEPPYEVLQTDALDFATLQRLRRFARFFDLIVNSGNFTATTALLWREGSAFARFLAFSDWLYARTRAQHGIALHRLAELLFHYLTDELSIPHETAGRALWRDFQHNRPNDWPAFLRPFASTPALTAARAPKAAAASRQARHGSRPE